MFEQSPSAGIIQIRFQGSVPVVNDLGTLSAWLPKLP
jgi:hypothetical protein